MGDGPPQSPESEPTPREREAPPPPSPGFNFRSVRDWYLRFANIREVANGNHYEEILGARVKLALSLMTTVIKGWSHSTIVGGSFTQIVGPDLKIGLGGAFSFLARGKTEKVKGRKDEKIYGIKISHVTGKKTKHKVGNETHNSAVALIENKNKCAEYWTMRKEMEQLLETKAAEMEKQHSRVEAKYSKMKVTYSYIDQTFDLLSQKAADGTYKYGKLLEQCKTVKEEASGQYQIIAASAAEVLASGKWEGYARGNVKLLASSLQKFAASVTKLG
jgi:hypothetical protein